MPYERARRLFERWFPASDPHEAYLTQMRLEVFWQNPKHLKTCFIHSGVEHIDPHETYVISSIHFGQWGMYPASLNQQFGIRSQMVASGRNRTPNSRSDHFWYHHGQKPQVLSGYPVCYSTDSFYEQLGRLHEGRNLVVILDVREKGLVQRELRTEFCGGPYFLQRSAPLMARRAKVRILPYFGFYDSRAGKHRVRWFPPVTPQRDDRATLQSIVAMFEPLFAARPEMYFNVLEFHRHPLAP